MKIERSLQCEQLQIEESSIDHVRAALIYRALIGATHIQDCATFPAQVESVGFR